MGGVRVDNGPIDCLLNVVLSINLLGLVPVRSQGVDSWGAVKGADMPAVHDQYEKFLTWMSNRDVPEDAVRVAKVVSANLDRVIPTVSNRGQRATVLAPLLLQSLVETDSTLGEWVDHAPAALRWSRLRLLSVGPFRGFRYEQRFDLDNRVVLFQGPNGSGKTSICEALEYALLGSVEEAESKRIDPLEIYFKNIHADQHAEPQLWAVGAPDDAPLESNPELLRFALIEKNRIESFARIGSHRPSEAQSLIATLFGLDAFSEFARNFTANLDNNLYLVPVKSNLLANRRQALAHSEAQVRNEATTLGDRAREEAELGAEAGMSFEDLVKALGLTEQPGRLQQLIEATDRPVRSQVGLRPSKFSAYRRSIGQSAEELRVLEEQLTARASEVNYKELYEAVSALREHSPDQCPACTTPLDAVAINPFARADAGRKALAEIVKLKEHAGNVRTQMDALQDNLLRDLTKLVDYQSVDGNRQRKKWVSAVERAGASEGSAKWKLLGAIDKDDWLDVLKVALRCMREDRAICKEREARASLVAERNRLSQFSLRATTLMERRRQAIDQIAAAKATIQQFEESNAELINEVAIEAQRIAHERRIQTAYSAFKAALDQYIETLPQTLLANLNELTRDIYNSINIRDPDCDKLSAVSLPLRGGERIQISFNGDPEERVDALHVLSEGHIRCLGLAILLAKNIQLGLPIVIFDDAVNAIDHDHRQGLRETLFENPDFLQKQLIITCHSPEFIKSILQIDGGALHYVLTHHAGDYQPRVLTGTTRHFVDLAQERLDNGDPRQCLAACRQALENLVYRIWRKLPPEFSLLKIPVRAPDTRADLFSVAQLVLQRLRDAISQGVLRGERWIARRDGLAAIIGVPQQSLTYSVLNKGAHEEEDREDFEMGLVETVLAALRQVSHSFRP